MLSQVLRQIQQMVLSKIWNWKKIVGNNSTSILEIYCPDGKTKNKSVYHSSIIRANTTKNTSYIVE